MIFTKTTLEGKAFIIDIDQLSKPIPNLSSLVANEGRYSLYEKNYICNDLSTESKPWGALIEFINGSLKDKVAVKVENSN